MLVRSFRESPKKVLRNLLGQNASTFKETLKKAEEASTLSPIEDEVSLPFLRFEFLWIGFTSGEFRAYVLTDIPVGQLKRWMQDLLSPNGWHMAHSWQTRYESLWKTAERAVMAAKKKSKNLDLVLDSLANLKRTQRLLIIKSASISEGAKSAPAGAKNEIAIPIVDFEATLVRLAIVAWGSSMMGWLTGEGASEVGMAKERHAFACAMLSARFDPGIAWQPSSNDKSISILKTDPLGIGSPKTGMGTLFGRPGIPLLSAAGDALYRLVGAICLSAGNTQPVLSAQLLESADVDWDNPLDLLRVFDPATIASAISNDPVFWNPMQPRQVMEHLGITDPHQQRALFPAFTKPFEAVCKLLQAAAIVLGKSRGVPSGWAQNRVPIGVDRAFFDQMETDRNKQVSRPVDTMLPGDKPRSDECFDESKHSPLAAVGECDEEPEDRLLACLEHITNEIILTKRDLIRSVIQEFQTEMEPCQFRDTISGFIAENRDKVKLTTLLIEILDPNKIPKRRR